MRKLLLLLVLGLLSGCGGSTNVVHHNAPTLKSITVAPANPTINLAGPGSPASTKQFTATGQMSDGSTLDLTGSVAWSSSNTGVATIASGGLATSVGVGSTTITATSSSISNSTNLTVQAELISITVLPSSASITLGNDQQFMATGNYSNGTSNDITSSVTWSSSATGVARISSSGLASSVSVGSTTITATVGSIRGTATLTVTQAALVSIAVTPGNASIPLGTLQQYTATGTYTDHTTQDITGNVRWKSSQTGIVSIASSGLVTARGLGSSTITATSGSISGSTTVSVNTANVVSLALQPSNATIANGTNLQYAAIATFNDGSTLNVTFTSGINWTGSTPSIATIGAHSGLAVAKAVGSTVIGVTFGSFSESVKLTVSNATIKSVSIAPVSPSIAPTTRQGFTATGTFSDDSTQNISTVSSWSSDNLPVATVSPGTFGVATGIAQGTANIRASFTSPGGPTTSGSTALTVSNATLQSISVVPANSVIAPAGIQQYTAVGRFSDGSNQTLTPVTWNSWLTNVATINSSGLATGISNGTTNITATFGPMTSPAAVLVVTASPLLSIAISCANPQIAQNTSEACTAVGTFTDSSTQKLTAVVHWTSSRPAVATVSNTDGFRGQVTGVSPGTTTLTAYLNGVVGTGDLTVTNANLTSITVSPSNAVISLGGVKSFTAIGNFDDGTTQNLTAFVNWTSSHSTVAIISRAGIATSTGTGSAVISATLNGVTGTANLTVN